MLVFRVKTMFVKLHQKGTFPQALEYRLLGWQRCDRQRTMLSAVDAAVVAHYPCFHCRFHCRFHCPCNPISVFQSPSPFGAFFAVRLFAPKGHILRYRKKSSSLLTRMMIMQEVVAFTIASPSAATLAICHLLSFPKSRWMQSLARTSHLLQCYR